MSYQYGKGSEAWFVGMLPELVLVFRRGLVISYERGGPDWSIVDGLRSKAYLAELIKIGKSHNPNSAHLLQPSGFAEAGDIRIYEGPGINPFPLKGDSPEVVRHKLGRFEEAASCICEAADELVFPYQWGNDWDVDGIPTGKDPDEKGFLQDLVHHQKAPPHRVKAALARREVRMAARARGERIIT